MYKRQGLHWFQALAGDAQSIPGLPASLRVADGELGGQAVRYLAVIADANNPFPRARNGEVGLLEGWGLAQAVDEAIEAGMCIRDSSSIMAIPTPPTLAGTTMSLPSSSPMKMPARVQNARKATP